MRASGMATTTLVSKVQHWTFSVFLRRYSPQDWLLRDSIQQLDRRLHATSP